MEYVEIDILKGKIISDIKQIGNDELLFYTSDGEVYKMYHEQNCCESVGIEEIIGDLSDLIDSPITMAEVVTQDGEEDDWGTSTWTFYKLATIKGYVTLRWLGESNGYYSEEVDFVKLEDNEF
ncbi:hypothetical protein [Bacillus cereus group sp. BfR-BA-01327]|uniref:DUF7448 domain-containing protein n=1 Tax=Bacillus cereus group sp. BfR-BA-01327 TaxID=2920303 RepID=UPI001F57DCF1